MDNVSKKKGFSITIQGYADFDPDGDAMERLEDVVRASMKVYLQQLQDELNSHKKLGVNSTMENFVLMGHSKSDYPKELL